MIEVSCRGIVLEPLDQLLPTTSNVAPQLQNEYFNIFPSIFGDHGLTLRSLAYPPLSHSTFDCRTRCNHDRRDDRSCQAPSTTTGKKISGKSSRSEATRSSMATTIVATPAATAALQETATSPAIFQLRAGRTRTPRVVVQSAAPREVPAKSTAAVAATTFVVAETEQAARGAVAAVVPRRGIQANPTARPA